MSQFRLTAILVASALAFVPWPGLCAPAANSQDYTHVRIVRLSLVDGDARVRRPAAEQWEQALVNLPIQQGYAVATSRGRLEIELESGATARIADNTILLFAELALADGGRVTRLELTQGTATFYAGPSRKDSFQVATPHLKVSIPGNARVRLDVLETGTDVRVLKGDINVDAHDTSQRLRKGQTLAFRKDSPEAVTIAGNAEPDAWDRWVANRDEVVTNASDNSLRYVSAPFRYGLADLSSYGSWLYDPFYGYVWQPWGISSGWLPYWDGRWAFLPGFGWTWVSYEPWGWLPYHYGRWLLTAGGWVWVPGGFGHWYPGLVGWLQCGDRIGWFPLGPHDRLGVVSKNLPSSSVVVNTPAGIAGGTPNRRLQLTANEGVWLFANAPTLSAGLPSRPQRVLDSSGREATGAAGPARKLGSEARFVDNPDALVRRVTREPRTPSKQASPGVPRTAPVFPLARAESLRPVPSGPHSQSAPRPAPTSPTPRNESRAQPRQRPR